MKKLDESKVKWIISQKQKKTTTKENGRNDEYLYSLGQETRPDTGKDSIVYPVPMCRPKNSLPRRREYFAVLSVIHKSLCVIDQNNKQQSACTHQLDNVRPFA